MKMLLERELIQIVGKTEQPGRPMAFGTTVGFLEFFNLMSLRDLPDLRPGVWWRVGGQRGDEHVGIVVEGPDREGWLTCVEGGQLDPLNPKPGAKGCTRIALKRRKVTGSPGRWILADRPLGYTADATNLPCLQTGERKGMPWEMIGAKS
jgi:hypothetical protein